MHNKNGPVSNYGADNSLCAIVLTPGAPIYAFANNRDWTRMNFSEPRYPPLKWIRPGYLLKIHCVARWDDGSFTIIQSRY